MISNILRKINCLDLSHLLLVNPGNIRSKLLIKMLRYLDYLNLISKTF